MIAIISKAHRLPCLIRLSLLLAATLVLAMGSVANAQQSFKTAEEAASALVGAARTGDQQRLLTVLGRDGAEIASSGDEVADQGTRQRFVAADDEKHQVTKDGDNKATLVIGHEDFPFPIPLVRKGGLAIRHCRRAPRNLVSPHWAQRTRYDPGVPRLCGRAE